MKFTIQELAELSETHKPGVEEQALITTENELGSRFPAQYRELVTITNSPFFGEWIFIPIKDPRNIAKTWDDVVRANQAERLDFLLPDFIAFADRGTYDFLCFKNVQGKMEDAIYFHDHEAEKPEKIANDLAEALSEIIASHHE